jgi:pSer/pThr/pTyr-binding forkhead associated (FHA) protein
LPGRHKNSGSIITLTTKKTVVGRGADCDLVIPHLSVSRRHAELSVEDGSLRVRDLKSRNGTFVDEQRIDSSPVEAGQLLRFGSVSFLITASGTDDLDSDAETASLSQARDSMLAEVERLNLTAAQRRVLDVLLDGLPEKQVAAKLRISQHTVHNHIRKIYVAACVGSRAELLAKFVSRKAFHRIRIASRIDGE